MLKYVFCQRLRNASMAQSAARQSHNHKNEKSEGREFEPHSGHIFFAFLKTKSLTNAGRFIFYIV